jgi:hypothetical protein
MRVGADRAIVLEDIWRSGSLIAEQALPKKDLGESVRKIRSRPMKTVQKSPDPAKRKFLAV